MPGSRQTGMTRGLSLKIAYRVARSMCSGAMTSSGGRVGQALPESERS